MDVTKAMQACFLAFMSLCSMIFNEGNIVLLVSIGERINNPKTLTPIYHMTIIGGAVFGRLGAILGFSYAMFVACSSSLREMRDKKKAC